MAYERGGLDDARMHFGRAALIEVDPDPDGATFEARASLGLLDALEGKAAAGRGGGGGKPRRGPENGPVLAGIPPSNLPRPH